MENSKRIQRRNKRNQTQVIDYKSLIQANKEAIGEAKTDLKAIEHPHEMVRDQTQPVNSTVDIQHITSLVGNETVSIAVTNRIPTQSIEVVENQSERLFAFSKTLDFFKNLEKANSKKPQQTENKSNKSLIEPSKEKDVDVIIVANVVINSSVVKQRSVNKSQISLIKCNLEKDATSNIIACVGIDRSLEEQKVNTLIRNPPEEKDADLTVIASDYIECPIEELINIPQPNTTEENILPSSPNNLQVNTETSTNMYNQFTNSSHSSDTVDEINRNDNNVLLEDRMFVFSETLNMWKSKTYK
ncbi:hypothetical protein NGRA_1786 [Nosema granulosis]|uniref:Uncharacterized protein n=1 Tax=Nosema granulosis TaxID=83296 RepID=A0A9P6GYS2_9MICR|nr:hypothetical protein NGRA_1786 [Nosema granulosis]